MEGVARCTFPGRGHESPASHQVMPAANARPGQGPLQPGTALHGLWGGGGCRSLHPSCTPGLCWPWASGQYRKVLLGGTGLRFTPWPLAREAIRREGKSSRQKIALSVTLLAKAFQVLNPKAATGTAELGGPAPPGGAGPLGGRGSGLCPSGPPGLCLPNTPQQETAHAGSCPVADVRTTTIQVGSLGDPWVHLSHRDAGPGCARGPPSGLRGAGRQVPLM